jgi:hypothetical protein
MGLQRKQATSLGATSNNVMTLGDIVDRYDVVSVERGVNNMGGYDGAAYIVVSERPPAMPSFPGNGMIAGGSDGHIDPVSSRMPRSPTYVSWAAPHLRRSLPSCVRSTTPSS